MKPKVLSTLSLLIALLSLSIPKVRAQSAPPVVHAVLFYSPTCGHCEYVITNTLMPLTGQYGDQLQIAALDVTQPQGQQLFQAALQKFGLDRGGVPFLVVDNIYLIGSTDIPERFPGMVETYLAQGGVDWPDIPGFAELLSPQPSPATPVPSGDDPNPTGSPAPPPAQDNPNTLSHAADLTWQERFALDPAGNTLSVIVLVGMLGALAWGYSLFRQARPSPLSAQPGWLIPALCLVGAGVAGYLAYVETAHVEAVCGPVGDCNTVQQSEYARLFGLLPIGVLGLFGYAAILVSWLVGRYAAGRVAKLAPLAILGMTLFGTLFSIYLTFLEPFVIGATCAWCLTSAFLITLLMLLSIPPARQALKSLKR